MYHYSRGSPNKTEFRAENQASNTGGRNAIIDKTGAAFVSETQLRD